MIDVELKTHIKREGFSMSTDRVTINFDFDFDYILEDKNIDGLSLIFNSKDKNILKERIANKVLEAMDSAVSKRYPALNVKYVSAEMNPIQQQEVPTSEIVPNEDFLRQFANQNIQGTEPEESEIEEVQEVEEIQPVEEIKPSEEFQNEPKTMEEFVAENEDLDKEDNEDSVIPFPEVEKNDDPDGTPQLDEHIVSLAESISSNLFKLESLNRENVNVYVNDEAWMLYREELEQLLDIDIQPIPDDMVHMLENISYIAYIISYQDGNTLRRMKVTYDDLKQ